MWQVAHLVQTALNALFSFRRCLRRREPTRTRRKEGELRRKLLKNVKIVLYAPHYIALSSKLNLLYLHILCMSLRFERTGKLY